MNNKLNTKRTDPGSANYRQNPVFLLSAGLQYLSAYTKALVREYELPEEDDPVTVICMSPDQEPCLDFSDRVELLNEREAAEIIEEKHTGLMMTCLEGELLADDEGFLLVGPAVLFKCDDGKLSSVSSLDYRRARELYAQGLDMYEMGRVKVPAIRIRLAGEILT